MPFAPLDDIPAVDAAFRAWGADLNEVFRSAWNAVRAVLLDREDDREDDRDTGAVAGELGSSARNAPDPLRKLELHERELDYLLLEFLQEQLYLKDAEAALYTVGELTVEREAGGWRLVAELEGRPIGQAGAQGVDVKAVTLDHLGVQQTAEGWEATVVLDL